MPTNPASDQDAADLAAGEERQRHDGRQQRGDRHRRGDRRLEDRGGADDDERDVGDPGHRARAFRGAEVARLRFEPAGVANRHRAERERAQVRERDAQQLRAAHRRSARRRRRRERAARAAADARRDALRRPASRSGGGRLARGPALRSRAWRERRRAASPECMTICMTRLPVEGWLGLHSGRRSTFAGRPRELAPWPRAARSGGRATLDFVKVAHVRERHAPAGAPWRLAAAVPGPGRRPAGSTSRWRGGGPWPAGRSSPTTPSSTASR